MKHLIVLLLLFAASYYDEMKVKGDDNDDNDNEDDNPIERNDNYAAATIESTTTDNTEENFVSCEEPQTYHDAIAVCVNRTKLFSANIRRDEDLKKWYELEDCAMKQLKVKINGEFNLDNALNLIDDGRAPDLTKTQLKNGLVNCTENFEKTQTSLIFDCFGDVYRKHCGYVDEDDDDFDNDDSNSG